MTAAGGDPDPPARPALPAAPPDAARWADLPDDLVRRIVPHVRRGLASLEGVQVTPEVRRLQAVPASKLGRGRTRTRLLAVLAEGGPAWLAVRQRILADVDVAVALAEALAAVDEQAPGTTGADGDDELVPAARLAEVARARDDQREQRDRARAERDRARRRAEGAEAREAALQAEVTRLQAHVDELDVVVASLRTDLEAADDRVEAAVARADRRTATERAELASALADARREVDELRRERARRHPTGTTDDGVRAVARTGAVGPATSATPAVVQDRVVPGRPSRLPPALRVDSREGAARLVEAVGRVLVDGYNVTRTQRGDLGLEQQRSWLVRGLEGLAARRGVDAVVVFDAHLDAAVGDRRARRGGGRGQVEVRWSHPGVTADDEIVFAVEAMDRDEPLVVVTDDRGLRDRLAPSRVDLLSTAALAWLLR